MAFHVNSHLPGISELVAAVTGAIHDAAGTVIPPKTEMIPDQLRFRRGGKGDGETDALRFGTVTVQFQLCTDAGKLLIQNDGAVGKPLGGQRAAAEGNGLPAYHGAKRSFTQVTAGVKDKRFTHGDDSFYRLMGMKNGENSYGSNWLSPMMAVPISSAVK